MSLNDSGDLGGEDGAIATTQESNVNAKLGEDSHSDKCLDWARFLGNCVIFTSEAGWTAQPWIHCVSKSCYEWTRKRPTQRARTERYLLSTSAHRSIC
jgi:hypothetical protein